jgi:hypothetical protein
MTLTDAKVGERGGRMSPSLHQTNTQRFLRHFWERVEALAWSWRAAVSRRQGRVQRRSCIAVFLQVVLRAARSGHCGD